MYAESSVVWLARAEEQYFRTESNIVRLARAVFLTKGRIRQAKAEGFFLIL